MSANENHAAGEADLSFRTSFGTTRIYHTATNNRENSDKKQVFIRKMKEEGYRYCPSLNCFTVSGKSNGTAYYQIIVSLVHFVAYIILLALARKQL